MNVKEIIFNNPSLNVESLIEVRNGVMNLEDFTITFDGMSFEESFDDEKEIAFSKLSNEKKVEHSFLNKDDEIPNICDIYVSKEDIYTDGLPMLRL